MVERIVEEIVGGPRAMLLALFVSAKTSYIHSAIVVADIAGLN